MEKILVFDNYDSFTYNLVHLVEKISDDRVVEVHRNDQIALEEIERFDRIILSPGPGIPEEAGQLISLIRMYGGRKPMLGVCLGQQAMAVAYGGKLVNLDHVYHGVATEMNVLPLENILFRGIDSPFLAGRYHSWVIDESTLPEQFTVTARDGSGQIMAIENKADRMFGVQFHPESIMTPDGERIVANFLKS
jgi:anthranilate synthase component II